MHSTHTTAQYPRRSALSLTQCLLFHSWELESPGTVAQCGGTRRVTGPGVVVATTTATYDSSGGTAVAAAVATPYLYWQTLMSDG